MKEKIHKAARKRLRAKLAFDAVVLVGIAAAMAVTVPNDAEAQPYVPRYQACLQMCVENYPIRECAPLAYTKCRKCALAKMEQARVCMLHFCQAGREESYYHAYADPDLVCRR